MTEAELLDALAEASAAPEDARTAQELADALAIPLLRVRQTLAALARKGRITVHRVRRPAIDGRMLPVPVYTIRPA